MIKLDRLGECMGCHLAGNPKVGSEGVGSRYDIMWVGRNPGQVEVRTKIPFTGKAGGRFDRIFIDLRKHKIKLERSDCYVTNLVKCFTQDNAKPSHAAIHSCVLAWLQMEVAILKPKLIITLGKEAWNGVQQLRLPVTGRPQRCAKLFEMTHPSAALRRPILEAKLRDETRQLAELLKEMGLV